MSCIYVYTLFDPRTKRPRCIGIKSNGNLVIHDLYRPGAGKIFKSIQKTEKIIRKLILTANAQERPIVLSDFKSHLSAFKLPLDRRAYHVYDLHLPDIKPAADQASDFSLIQKILEKMEARKIYPYQRIMAEAAVVYQDLENAGLIVNYMEKRPIWSQKTYSGRSKTTGFNIQGLSEPLYVTQPGWCENGTLIHFDWICADIRVASLLSQDRKLLSTFDDSDPYTTMMHELNIGSDSKISREESKRYLLKSINSMDFTSVALSEIYPGLGSWIKQCKDLARDGLYLKTILSRKFRRAQAKNELAMLNGVMQGSVAHAMQLTIRRIWERLPTRLVAEIHDSLVMTAADSKDIRFVIDIVAPIMMHPFEGILDENPAFQFKVSIGKKWKKWKLLEIHRPSGVTRNVQKVQTKEDRSDEETKASAIGTQEEKEKTT